MVIEGRIDNWMCVCVCVCVCLCVCVCIGSRVIIMLPCIL